jgi:hypothetical protein
MWSSVANRGNSSVLPRRSASADHNAAVSASAAVAIEAALARDVRIVARRVALTVRTTRAAARPRSQRQVHSRVHSHRTVLLDAALRQLQRVTEFIENSKLTHEVHGAASQSEYTAERAGAFATGRSCSTDAEPSSQR